MVEGSLAAYGYKLDPLVRRISGYAVNFVRLTREQQLDVVNRTFHAGL